MVSLYGDDKAIRRLVTILLDNAVKYSDEGGEISIRLKQETNHSVCLQYDKKHIQKTTGTFI